MYIYLLVKKLFKFTIWAVLIFLFINAVLVGSKMSDLFDCCLGLKNSYAQSLSQSLSQFTSQNDINLGVYPSNLEIETSRGAIIEESLVIFGNPATQLSFEFTYFEPDGIDGHIKTYLPETQLPYNVDPISWISVPISDFEIPNTQTSSTSLANIEIPLLVSVPQDARLGEYYLTIFVVEKNIFGGFESSQSSAVVGKLGINLVLRVVDENFVPESKIKVVDISAGRIQFKLPTILQVLVENSGSKMGSVKGKTLIKPWGGLIESQFQELPIVPLNVIPGAKRLLVSESTFVNGEFVEGIEIFPLKSVENEFLDYIFLFLPNLYMIEILIDNPFTDSESTSFFFIYMPIGFLIFIGIVFVVYYLKKKH